MDYRKYITIDPNKRGGKPCVRELRVEGVRHERDRQLAVRVF